MVIDFHAHVYPEKIAQRAAESIGAFYDVRMHHPGSVPVLLERMAEGGIDRSLIHSVALAPSRAATINDFIAREVSEHPQQLTGYATLHPDMTEAEAEEELATLPQLATEDMFITEHYFIETSSYGVAIVPIDAII